MGNWIRQLSASCSIHTEHVSIGWPLAHLQMYKFLNGTVQSASATWINMARHFMGRESFDENLCSIYHKKECKNQHQQQQKHPSKKQTSTHTHTHTERVLVVSISTGQGHTHTHTHTHTEDEGSDRISLILRERERERERAPWLKSMGRLINRVRCVDEQTVHCAEAGVHDATSHRTPLNYDDGHH